MEFLTDFPMTQTLVLAPDAIESERVTRWISLSRAGELLGVSQATLRGWADRGQIPSFRTPGGHRRFSEAHIAAMLNERQGPDSPPPLDSLGDRAAGHIRRKLAHARPPQREWFRTLAPEDRDRLRLFGRQLLSLVMRSRTRRRARTAVDARSIGEAYASEGLQRGLRLAEVVEAFVFFREMLDDVLKELVKQEGTRPEQVVDLWRHMNSTLDAVLLATVVAYERASGPAVTAVTAS